MSSGFGVVMLLLDEDVYMLKVSLILIGFRSGNV
jgi:hypothetical protein